MTSDLSSWPQICFCDSWSLPLYPALFLWPLIYLFDLQLITVTSGLPIWPLTCAFSLQTFLVLGKGKVIHRFNAHKACYLFSPVNPLRRFAIKFLTNSYLFCFWRCLCLYVWSRFIGRFPLTSAHCSITYCLWRFWSWWWGHLLYSHGTGQWSEFTHWSSSLGGPVDLLMPESNCYSLSILTTLSK